MNEPDLRLDWLREARLRPLAVSALPAWLWSADATRVLWANPTGAAIFGAPTAAALATRAFDLGQPAAAQVARLAASLPPHDLQRLERLRGFGAGIGRALMCNCAAVMLADGTAAVFIVAAERAGPDLPLTERVHRLLAGSDAPLAAFSGTGTLIDSTPAALAWLDGKQSIAELEIEPLVATANETGRAAGDTTAGRLVIDRLDADAETILIVRFGAAEIDEPAPAPSTVAAAPPADPADEGGLTVAPISDPPAPAERRHPLRFVWQIDAEGRFTLESDEFCALMGPRITVALGHSWDDLAAALGLDPDGQVKRAIATHDTWSGLTVAWPVDDGSDQLIVELSGLPAFDRERTFRGYRGFGVCRDVARLNTVIQRRHAAMATAVAPAATIATPDQIEVEHAVGETAPVTPPVSPRAEPVVPAEERSGENIVPFPGADADALDAPILTAIERRAFRELARRLTELTTAARARATTAAPELDAAPDQASNTGTMPDPPAAHTPEVTTPETAQAAPEPAFAEETVGASEVDQALFADSAYEPPIAQDVARVLDRFPVGVLVYRLNDLIYANQAFLHWSGHESVESLNEAGGLDSLYIEPGALAIEHGSEKPFAITGNRGEKIPAEGRLFLVPWGGDSAYVLVTMPVTTLSDDQAGVALKAAQAEISELNAILDTATDGVILLDGAGRILSANRSAQALFGYEADQLVGQAFVDLLTSESAGLALDYLETLQRDGVASVLNDGRDVIGRERQGGLMPLFMSIGRVDEKGGKFCAVFRDLTQWKKSEKELTEAKHQAEKASSAKSDFLAKISHEIRTPLNAVIGFSEVMMEERFGPIENDRYRGYLKDIHASGGHLISLINDLLDLSKIEAGKLDLSFTDVALNDLTQQCVALMQPQANRERVIIRTSLAPKLPHVVADARSVRQIVLNLLSNSIKFTGAGGQVIVSTALSDAGEVVFRVRDTGVGMSEKEIVTALEPFRQLATSTRFGSGGTGLGLPLTKALAEANRASFRINSKPNSGTLVEVAFPATRVLAE